jgi:hypothetical protein
MGSQAKPHCPPATFFTCACVLLFAVAGAAVADTVSAFAYFAVATAVAAFKAAGEATSADPATAVVAVDDTAAACS